jgi:selenocysteine lyase/cysteine desulfurase
MTNWANLRRDAFPALGDLAFLNAASVGPMPAAAIEMLAITNSDRGRPDCWPKQRLDDILSRSRELCAALIGATAEEIALTTNTTTGLNIAARALPLSRGDVVITFDREFPANVYPWLARANEGIVLERIAPTAAGWPDEAALLERLQHPSVKAVCVSLTQFSNGYTVDLARLSAMTRELNKWLVVDAIQGVGQLPIDVTRTPVDFLACGAQKWLLSPWGTGFVYVRQELIEQFPPTFAGWASYIGTDDYTKLTAYDPRPWPDARRYEVITLPIQDFAAMNVSLELMLDIGIEKIRDRLADLVAPILAAAERGEFTLTSPTGTHGSAITCIKPLGDVAEYYQRLTDAGIICSLREGAVRLSPHLYNTEADIGAVLDS